MIVYNNYDLIIQQYVSRETFNEYLIGKGKNQVLYNYVPMGFDIETTTQYKKDDNGKVIEHYTNMYIWQFQIGENTYIGRTWEELNDVINAIEKYICFNHRKTIVFIANMSFEFQFCAKQFLKMGHITEVFARKKRKPMKWTLDNKIVFLDTVLLTHLPLALLAKSYCTTQKMVGDLDYTIIRNKYTPLNDEEIGYCVNDVVILKEYAEYYENEYMTHKLMPMTQTMIANLDVKKSISELKAGQDIYFLMQKQYPKNKQQYDYLMLFFSGAYTHGMLQNLFRKLSNGLAYDVCSEYPYVMMSKYYPMGNFKKLNDLTKIDAFLKKFCCLCDVTLTNIKTKYGVTILSKNRLIETQNAIYDNGRLFSADSVRAFITEVDIETLEMHYTFNIKYNSCIYAKRGFLPDYLRLAIAELYKDKTELKGVQGFEREYMSRKGSLNAQYGSMCTRLTFREIAFSSEWEEHEKDLDFSTIWRGKNKLPQWAIYVTAHARKLVLTPVYEICKINPSDYWYTDTDSIKAKNKKYIMQIFDKMNKQIKADNETWINALQLKERFPTIDFSEMGQFSREEDMLYFKTLGSKRYIYTTKDGKQYQTIAGLPKTAFIEYCKKYNKDFYNAFTMDGVRLADYESEKLTAFYEDSPQDFEVIDNYGNVEKVHTESYLSLIPVTFNLNVASDLVRLYTEYIGMENNR